MFLLCGGCLQDRVIINRLDSICHAVLKGKWPSSSEQYDSAGSLSSSSCLASSLGQHQQHRASFLPTPASSSIPGQARVQQANAGLGFPIPPPLTRLPKVRTHEPSAGTSIVSLRMNVCLCPYLPPLPHSLVYGRWCPVCDVLKY